MGSLLPIYLILVILAVNVGTTWQTNGFKNSVVIVNYNTVISNRKFDFCHIFQQGFINDLRVSKSQQCLCHFLEKSC